MLKLILDFTPRQAVYPVLKGVDRQFFYLIQQRKRGLAFAKSELTQKMFFGLLAKARGSITSLSIRVRSFNFVSPSNIESQLITMPGLLDLDLLKF